MVHTYVQQFIQWVIGHGGVYMIAFILFAETGLFLGFFLPGDSLLFAAGLYLNELARTFFAAPLWLIILLLVLATATGSWGISSAPDQEIICSKETTAYFSGKSISTVPKTFIEGMVNPRCSFPSFYR